MRGAEMTCTTQTIPTDEALQLVADNHRRAVLRCLMERKTETIAVETVVADVVGSVPIRRPEYSDQLHRLRTTLRHTHLPKLAEKNVIEYDAESRTIRYRPNEKIEELVNFVSTTFE